MDFDAASCVECVLKRRNVKAIIEMTAPVARKRNEGLCASIVFEKDPLRMRGPVGMRQGPDQFSI